MGRKADGRRDQRTYTYDTKKGAKTERARIISEVAKGTYVRPNRSLTVKGYLVDDWLPTKAGKKPSTVSCYETALVQVIAEYGDLPLQALDVPHLERLKRRMLSGELRRVGKPGEPLSPRTVNLMLTVLTMALKPALRRGLVVRNVAEIVERLESDPDAGADRGEWQADDARRSLRFVSSHRLYAALVLSLLGLRRGEVTGLRWDDIDLTGDQALARNRTRSIGERSISPSSTSHRKNCCSPLCLFSAVAAARVSIIQAWNASMCALVLSVGSSAASSASGSGECWAK